ncbi:MAG TPA: hypothetical protein VF544_04255 [Pyrinomonadaceae bacterium]
MKLKSAIINLALLAGLAILTPTAQAAKAYYVRVNDVLVRSQPGEFAMGRLYTSQRMDIQYVDPDGHAYGFAYGHVNRCVWAQFIVHGSQNFWTHGTQVADRCRNTGKYLQPSEFTNGEVWGTTDGLYYTIRRDTYMWDNWLWGRRWGNHSYRGVAPAGSVFKIRYTTNDGVGVMARRCSRNLDGSVICYPHDWLFIQRSAL